MKVNVNTWYMNNLLGKIKRKIEKDLGIGSARKSGFNRPIYEGIMFETRGFYKNSFIIEYYIPFCNNFEELKKQSKEKVEMIYKYLT